MLSMWNDLTFDKVGNLYVPDDKPRIWRVGKDGTAEIWFSDPRLTGLFGFAGGPLGGRIDPTGQWLYISITIAAEFAPSPDSTIYRIRLVDHPTAADLELVHRFVASPDPTIAPPQATGLAFAKSGNLYVSLLGPNEVAVLDPLALGHLERADDRRARLARVDDVVRMLGVAGAGAAVGAAGIGGFAVARADGASADTERGNAFAFHGSHQAGIVTPAFARTSLRYIRNEDSP